MTWRRLLAAVRDFLTSMYGWQSYDEASFQQQVRAILRPLGDDEAPSRLASRNGGDLPSRLASRNGGRDGKSGRDGASEEKPQAAGSQRDQNTSHLEEHKW
jgi:hypothetical protein